MEVSALKYSGGIGLHGRSRLLRLQSDERLVAFLRKGNTAAFEILFARYETRLLAFCRHLLGSREDAEDVLQEVMTAAFNAMLADERPINVRPWLYRIARNRSLNHMRRSQAIGVDSMDLHFSDNGASTADKVHEREEFRLLVGDIHELPETQKTALVLREMDALSYEQIAEAMETTVPSVKSLLVRARVSLAEAAEARLLTCDEVRIELAEVTEGLRRRAGPLVRRHLRGCKRCSIFRTELKHTNKALAALLPVGPAFLLKKLLIAHLGHSAGAGSGAAGSGAAGAGAAGAGATGAAGAGAGAGAVGTALAGSTIGGGGFVSAGIGAIAAKTAAGLAAAALVTGAAVEAGHNTAPIRHAESPATTVAAVQPARSESSGQQASVTPLYSRPEPRSIVSTHNKAAKPEAPAKTTPSKGGPLTKATGKPIAATPVPTATSQLPPNVKAAAPAGRTQNQTDPTVLPPSSVAPVNTTSTPSSTTTPTAPSATTTTPTAPSATTPTTPTTPTTTPTSTNPPPTTTTPTTPTTPATTPTSTNPAPPTTTPPTTTNPTPSATISSSRTDRRSSRRSHRVARSRA